MQLGWIVLFAQEANLPMKPIIIWGKEREKSSDSSLLLRKSIVSHCDMEKARIRESDRNNNEIMKK